MNVAIHHNPECGTSRNVLAIIEAAGYRPTVISRTTGCSRSSSGTRAPNEIKPHRPPWAPGTGHEAQGPHLLHVRRQQPVQHYDGPDLDTMLSVSRPSMEWGRTISSSSSRGCRRS